jgi:hypothetical protein
MKRFAFVLSLVIGAWMLSPTPEADARGSHKWAKRHNHQQSQSRAGVPELDPSAAGGAMILLLGGVAYISSRRREDDLV